ncbi:uncharacterized protein ATNIH1004_011710 [Aspergillus tanneri]|uniref:MADS-box domain-containing protein n=1 Tax=Aspergillus tanneri TaxID=1220188 RepID=A0A5M9M8A2_9EURO|nr:uncharacterized protein ATNIH1004_011710 [Aspergillus tanneri]KAA8641574.1 hypothetical protein ATNIH1004_011710 [Aspergillus tanneri]
MGVISQHLSHPIAPSHLFAPIGPFNPQSGTLCASFTFDSDKSQVSTRSGVRSERIWIVYNGRGTKTIRTRHSKSLELIRQKQARRRNSLLWKSFEYCRECDAHVFMMTRLRHNGQVVFSNSNAQWPLSRSSLPHPTPREITWHDMATKFAGGGGVSAGEPTA